MNTSSDLPVMARKQDLLTALQIQDYRTLKKMICDDTEVMDVLKWTKKNYHDWRGYLSVKKTQALYRALGLIK